MASGEHGSHQPVRSTDQEPDGTLAKGLASEDILEILRMILAGAPLKEVLTSVARVVESHREGMLCSVWLLDQDRVHMRAIAAPTLPESYVAALDGLVVGPQGGSCGAAVNQRKPVFVSDVLTDPILEQVRDIIAAHGIRACWSAPIISHQGEILGTFAFYFRSVRSPSPRDIHLIENATSIAGIAIERKKAEENLRRSEWSLLEAQRLGHSGSWSLDVSSGIVTTSLEMLRSFDVKPGEDCSSPDFWFNRIHPEDRKRIRDLFQRCVMEKTDYEAHYRLLLPDGAIKYQHSIGRPIVNEKGDLVEFVGTAIDVTEQAQARIELEKAFEEIKQRTEALRRSEGYLAEAQKLTHTGSWAWNVRTGALFWSQEIFRIYDYNPQGIAPTWPQFLERVHPEDRPKIEQRAKMETTRKDWVDSQADFRIVLPDGTIKRLHTIAHPVMDESGEMTEVVGTAMDVTEQVQARIELEKAFEEIKQRTEAARRSERELRDVVNTVPANVWSTSPEGAVDFVNDRCLQFTGLALDEIFGWKWEPVLHPDDRTRVVADWHTAVKNGQAMESEARVRRADGEYCWWFIRNVPLRDETGKLVRWYGTAIDIEDRKRAEQALRKGEERWRSVFENSAIGVALTDLSGRFLATNHVYQTIVGYTEEELHALRFLDVTHEDHREANWALVTELLEGKRRQVQLEKKYRRKDGTSIWVSNNVSLVPGTESVPRFIMALSEDITQRKHAEEALQRSEGYLAEAQKLTHTGSWAVRIPQTENAQREAGQELTVIPRSGWTGSYWSTEMYRIFGLDPGPTPPSYLEVVERMHPEDARNYTPAVEQAIRDRTDFEIDYRLLLPNGAPKYIHVVGHPVVNAAGDVIELVGTAMDITEQHEARAALEIAFEQIKAEETELRRMTDAIASYIYVFRPDGTALYANQTVLDYTGLTLEDVQREDQRARVFHPEDVERLRGEGHEALARGKPFELEQRVLGKDGNYRWFLARYNPLRDDHGHIIRWYATGTDIEDRKRAEERMRDENLALREQIDQAFMFEEIVGSSPALQTVLSSIVKVAPTDSTVLITGETGTGKELIARAVHKHSQRSSQAFISVNCSSIPSSLIASELFGHEKGAFTGAVQRRQGRFEMAHSGTIFLDEVGDLPAETQIALLRVLQERQFE